MMKLAMKKIMAAAAIAAMAMSGTANAAYFTGGASGDSDLIFSAWDDIAGVGYTLDLGVSLNTLFGADNATVGSNLAIANSTVVAALINNGFASQGARDSFNSFLTAAGGTNNVMWNLAAAENNGRARVLTTNAANASLADFSAAQTNDNIALTADAFNAYVTAVGVKAGGSSYLNTNATSDGVAYAGYWGTRQGGHGLDSANALSDGFHTNLYLFGQAGTDGIPPPGMGTFSQAMTVDGRALTVTVFLDASGAWDIKVSSAQIAAVPEADTYAMLLAGLGLIFFIVLRRRSQA